MEDAFVTWSGTQEDTGASDRAGFLVLWHLREIIHIGQVHLNHHYGCHRAVIKASPEVSVN